MLDLFSKQTKIDKVLGFIIYKVKLDRSKLQRFTISKLILIEIARFEIVCGDSDSARRSWCFFKTHVSVSNMN